MTIIIPGDICVMSQTAVLMSRGVAVKLSVHWQAGMFSKYLNILFSMKVKATLHTAILCIPLLNHHPAIVISSR